MNPLFLLGTGIVSMGMLSAYLVTQLPKSYKIKWLLIPLFVWIAAIFGFRVNEVLGYPKDGYPKEEFSLVAFGVKQTKDKSTIQAWLVINGQSRLYEFPFTPELVQELQELAEKGHGAKGKFHGTGHGLGGQDNHVGIDTIAPPVTELPHKD